MGEGVQASGLVMMCAPEYYSYTNILNPIPCIEVLFAQTYLYDQANGGWWGQAAAPFIPFEDLEECTTSYFATVDAYFAAYLASDIASYPGIETDMEDIQTVEEGLIMAATTPRGASCTST